MDSKKKKKKKKKKTGKPAKNCCVYAIILDAAKFTKTHMKSFKDENPDWIEDMPAYYIGQSAKTPDARYEDHKRGHKSSIWVEKYGVGVEHHMCELNLTRSKAIAREEEKADEERKLGIGIWWG